MAAEPFNGSKLAILVGDLIVTILRDDKPDIPWPGMWDLPGGGREGDETPETCVLRETREELGLILTEDALIWKTSSDEGGDFVWFFVCEQPDFDVRSVVFGDEGQRWNLVPLSWFLDDPSVIPRHKSRLAAYLGDRHRVPGRVARGQPLAT